MKLIASLAVAAVTCVALGQSASALSLGFKFKSGDYQNQSNQQHNGFNNLFNNIQNIINNLNDCKVDFDPCDDNKKKHGPSPINFTNIFDCGPSNGPSFPKFSFINCNEPPKWDNCAPKFPKKGCGPQGGGREKCDPPTAVPTPSAVGMGLAVMGFAAARRRRRDESAEG